MHPIFYALLSLPITGCISQIASVDDVGRSWIGHPYTKLRSRSEGIHTNPQLEKTDKLADGSIIYTQHIIGDCLVIWTIDPEGIIIDYRAEGKQCP